jgi:hypothetical protein
VTKNGISKPKGPDEPGGNIWNNLLLADRAGVSESSPGCFDAELNLVYFGAAPTYDTNFPRIKNTAPRVKTMPY